MRYKYAFFNQLCIFRNDSTLFRYSFIIVYRTNVAFKLSIQYSFCQYLTIIIFPTKDISSTEPLSCQFHCTFTANQFTQSFLCTIFTFIHARHSSTETNFVQGYIYTITRTIQFILSFGKAQQCLSITEHNSISIGIPHIGIISRTCSQIFSPSQTCL